jgi:hypothetical protein
MYCRNCAIVNELFRVNENWINIFQFMKRNNCMNVIHCAKCTSEMNCTMQQNGGCFECSVLEELESSSVDE